MSAKSAILAVGFAATLLASTGTAFASPETTRENLEQYAVSREERAFPSSPAAATAELARISRPSAFHIQGPYNAPLGPFQATDPHWGGASDGTDD
ncbi:hypothetical protein [Xanthobacter sp. KR7-225]|uniref:hypothetical protein n=1 Tax=Xanthobacter sp. KR7-225 TaxID=3156613 RepID=UPI0032B3B380